MRKQNEKQIALKFFKLPNTILGLYENRNYICIHKFILNALISSVIDYISKSAIFLSVNIKKINSRKIIRSYIISKYNFVKKEMAEKNSDMKKIGEILKYH